MLPLRRSSFVTVFLLAVLSSTLAVAAYCQDVPSDNSKLALSAEVVLTQEFCSTKTKKGDFVSGKETFEVGKAACAEIEPALKKVFQSLIRVDSVPSAGDTQVVLLPRFVDVGATRTALAFSNRELVVLVEWTVKDKSGNTLWLETVQGSSKHHMGNLFTHGKNVRLVVNDSVKDMAEQTAVKMGASPELRKLGDTSTTAAAPN